LVDLEVSASRTKTDNGLKNRTYSILVTDIEDFTGFKIEHGADPADEVLKKHDEIVEKEIKLADGDVLKTTGDGYLGYFETESRAIIAATRIQRKLFEHNQAETTETKIPSVRIGISSGPVTERQRANQRDMLGATVDKTFRICSMANGNHIFMQSRPHQDILQQLKGHKLWPTILEHMRLEDKGEVVWKGGREVPISITEVVYKRLNDWIQPQRDILVAAEIVYDKGGAINLAEQMVTNAKERLLVALKTLPVLTGPNDMQQKRESDADKRLLIAIEYRLKGIANNTDSINQIHLVYSSTDSKKYIQEAHVKDAELEERLEFLKKTKESARDRFALLRARSLQNAIIISDNMMAVWNFYQSKGARKGFAIRIASADGSSSLWNHVVSELCDKEEDDYERYSTDLR
jgi:class 3 adenylate cyclase